MQTIQEKNIFLKAKTSKTTKHIETSSNISNYAQATDCIISAPMVELVVRSTIWVLAVPDICSMNFLATNSAKNHDWPKGLAKRHGDHGRCARIQSLGPIV